MRLLVEIWSVGGCIIVYNTFGVSGLTVSTESVSVSAFLVRVFSAVAMILLQSFYQFLQAGSDRLCARSWLSGNLGKTALRLLEIFRMDFDTSLKTSRRDCSGIFCPTNWDSLPLRPTNFFFSSRISLQIEDGRERRNPRGHGRHYDARTN